VPSPTYDFYGTVNPGRTAIANGQLLSTSNPADANFSGGSTFHWHSCSGTESAQAMVATTG
jgi:hypothetical protein